MLHRTKVVDVELSSTPTDIEGLDGYTRLMVLARLHGAPIGIVHLPVTNGRCTATTIRKAILDRQQGWPIIHHLLCDLLAAPPCPDGWSVSDLLNAPHPAPGGPLPLVSVAVCTRDRPTDLAICLKALDQLDYPHLDVLVVDNAPGSDATERLMCETYPHIRYVREPRPGLDWARNRAIVEARGEIIAFTDDDTVVDPGWVRAIADLFVENPDVMAVTGLVMPYELETEAQILFELYGGFGRGCERKWYRLGQSDRERWKYYGTGQFGTGANMAYRRSLFDQIGYFDPALDVGTVTNGGGDLDMFFRVLVEGHTLVYEPRAIVRHRHRRDYGRLRMQIANNGVGLVSYWVRSALAYPEERLALLRVALWWLWYWDIRRLLMSFVRPAKFPRDLIQVELKGYFIGLTRYQKARQIADQIADTFDQFPSAITSEMHTSRNITDKLRSSIAVRTIDLAQPLTALADVTGHPMVRTFVTQNSHLLGHLDIHNDHQPISATYLRQAIANHIGLRLLKSDHNTSENLVWAELTTRLARHFMPARSDSETATPTRLSAAISVSVVVATRDRPDDLRTCLRCLMALKSPRQVEIVVVDNNPASGLTPPVAAEFPEVVLVSEPRQGLAYARNAGFTASTGDIVITTDDDVVAPPDWIENLLGPLAQPDVMIVTGNILPLELETSAQCLFEQYGGLGRGYKPREVGRKWFESFRRSAVPTWELGATANAAFRASIFHHPQIGLMDEALGPGMPSGVGEDTYLIYKVLKEGYRLAYEPKAYVWHKHRREMSALHRQIYNYSKGHVAYHLVTLFQDHDLRALLRLGCHLPKWRIKQILSGIKHRLSGKGRNYPLSLILIEIVGNLVGPWALWRSRRRVRREGHSKPYVPVSQRSVDRQDTPQADALKHAVAVPQHTTAFSP